MLSCPESRWRQTWQTCTPINPPLHHPQAEEEPRPDPPPAAHDESAPNPAEETASVTVLKTSRLKL